MSKQHKHDGTTTGGDYLWDRSGEPDLQIQHLEQSLARFRHARSAPPFDQVAIAARRVSWWQQLGLTFFPARAVAAALVVLAAISGLWLSMAPRPQPPLSARDGWQVQIAPQQGAENASVANSSLLRVGDALETGSTSKATIAVAEIGRLEVDPMTRLRLLQSAGVRKRIALDRGTIHATIWAPPGQFVVDTPSAVAVDLGCMYTLHIDDSGSGLLHTTLGWVGFRLNGHESFIPAGAACPTDAHSGPGTPYFEDAPDAFRSALAQLDSADSNAAGRQAALQTVLREARQRDALTLWHLLRRVSSVERPAVFDRLAALVHPPPTVTREGILRLDQTMLDSWWNALDLGDIGLWRHWEQSWTGREGWPR